MFLVERQQDRELESLQCSTERRKERESLPPPDGLHSVSEKKDPANVPG
jgi:hypothetical protein